MLGDTVSRRRARRALAPWLLAGVAVWLAFDNGPGLVEEWRLRGADSGTATVLSTDGGRPQRAIRRLWDDLVWGRGRRITYRFEAHDRDQATTAAFVTHGAADDPPEMRIGGAFGRAE